MPTLSPDYPTIADMFRPIARLEAEKAKIAADAVTLRAMIADGTVFIDPVLCDMRIEFCKVGFYDEFSSVTVICDYTTGVRDVPVYFAEHDGEFGGLEPRAYEIVAQEYWGTGAAAQAMEYRRCMLTERLAA